MMMRIEYWWLIMIKLVPYVSSGEHWYFSNLKILPIPKVFFLTLLEMRAIHMDSCFTLTLSCQLNWMHGLAKGKKVQHIKSFLRTSKLRHKIPSFFYKILGFIRSFRVHNIVLHFKFQEATSNFPSSKLYNYMH